METEKLLKLLRENKVRFVVIGATAFPVHGYARATLDIDLFVEPTIENIKRLRKALTKFGYDLVDITDRTLLTKKLLVRQYLVETDIHPFVKGVDFESVWKSSVRAKFGRTMTRFAGLDDLIQMKRAAGRAKDKEDLKFLVRIRKKLGNRKIS